MGQIKVVTRQKYETELRENSKLETFRDFSDF